MQRFRIVDRDLAQMHDRLRPVPSTAERGNTVSPAHEHLPDALGPRQGPWLQQRSCAKDLDAQQSAFLVEVEHDPADTLYLVHVLTHGLPLPNAGCNREIGCVGLMIVGTERSFRHGRTLLSELRKVPIGLVHPLWLRRAKVALNKTRP